MNGRELIKTAFCASAVSVLPGKCAIRAFANTNREVTNPDMFPQLEKRPRYHSPAAFLDRKNNAEEWKQRQSMVPVHLDYCRRLGNCLDFAQ